MRKEKGIEEMDEIMGIKINNKSVKLFLKNIY
jgi:hypothetical protein